MPYLNTYILYIGVMYVSMLLTILSDFVGKYTIIILGGSIYKYSCYIYIYDCSNMDVYTI